MLTGVPTGPLIGVNELIVGGGPVTVNGSAVVQPVVPVSTVTGPVEARSGTVAVMLVGELTMNAPPAMPSNNTSLTAEVKLVPVISTLVPTGPLVGVNELIVGPGDSQVTVNWDGLVAVPNGVVTVIGPVPCGNSCGTPALILVGELTVKP